MDPRLVAAILDVLGESPTNVSLGATAGRAAGPAVRKSILGRAATKNASTGTPIPNLRGIAADRATLAAVGGGAKAAGGSGIAGGLQVLDKAVMTVQLAAYGITAAAIVAEIGIRYAAHVRSDRAAAAAEIE